MPCVRSHQGCTSNDEVATVPVNNKLAAVRQCLDGLQHHLDLAYSVFQVKLIWLYRIRADNQSYNIKVVDITDPPREVITIAATAEHLKALHDPYVVEIRRGFVNDLFLVVARDGLLARNSLAGKQPIHPEFFMEPHEEEVAALSPFLAKEEKRFLDFFRRIRNSTVHYDGNHNVRNGLDFEFNGTHFLTTDANVGTQINYWLSDLVAIYQRLKVVFDLDKLLANPYLQHLASDGTGAA